MDKFQRLREKHGAALLGIKPELIRQQGVVNSWLELHVLLNDRNPNHRKKKKRFSLAPFFISTIPTVMEEEEVKSIPPPKTGLKAYEQLPLPQNSRKIMMDDRQTYDRALDQQIQIEQAKLEEMIESATSTTEQVQKQQDVVNQLIQQKELVLRQQRQALEAKMKKYQAKQAEKAAQQAKTAVAASVPEKDTEPVLQGPALEAALRAFFLANEPEALEDGRLEAVLIWTEQKGVPKLCAMLREQYGKDIYDRGNDAPMAIDHVQADRIARRLMGFYNHHKVQDISYEKCQKIGEWSHREGLAALNAKLRTKYNDDLDSYAIRVTDGLGEKLHEFYRRYNPESAESDLEPILNWTVANGLEALNKLLRKKYGVDLEGIKAKDIEIAQYNERIKSGRAAFHRELAKDESRDRRVSGIKTPKPIYKREAVKGAPPQKERTLEELVALRKGALLSQLAAFLEVRDPKRLELGGLVPLVQWALPRSDQQVDELLMESYGADLKEAGLRNLSFDDEEIKSFRVEVEGPGSRALRAASNVLEDDLVRSEVRSMRITSEPAETTVVEVPLPEYPPEPDF